MNSSQQSKTASDVWAVQATCGGREPTLSSVPPRAAAATYGVELSYSPTSAGEHEHIYFAHIRADLMLLGSSQLRTISRDALLLPRTLVLRSLLISVSVNAR